MKDTLHVLALSIKVKICKKAMNTLIKNYPSTYHTTSDIYLALFLAEAEFSIM